MVIPRVIKKKLSANDIGTTGSHQAGILVPRNSEVLPFFPKLGNTEKNPRMQILFTDRFGKVWKLNFIYYNNKFFDEKGTRNEYRLTGLTAYFRENNLKENDYLVLEHHDDDEYFIDYIRGKELIVENKDDGSVKLKLSNTWTVVSMR